MSNHQVVSEAEYRRTDPTAPPPPPPQELLTQTVAESGNGIAGARSYPTPTAQYEQLVQSADLFWEKLQSFHHSYGTHFKVPTVGGKPLDLHHLFVEVTSHGGLEKIIRDRKWKEVISVFNFPTSVTSSSFVLRKYYLSLLYHFEQAYYFRKEAPSLRMPDPVNGSLVKGSASIGEDISKNELPGTANATLQLGSLVAGTIDGKFDNAYLVSVNMGSEQLKGVLYHISLYGSENSYASDLHTHRNRKRSRLALRDPSNPKSNQIGYDFFFAEHYARLKPLYHGQERAISKKIGFLWSNLTEAERQVYREKGLKDKERYWAEMSIYKSMYDFAHQ